MEVTICGQSAWQYWRTPPLLRDAEIDKEALRAWWAADPGRKTRVPWPSARRRKNMRRSEELIDSRMLGELKGVSLPVHVLVDNRAGTCKSDLVVHHRTIREDLLKHRTSLGGDLYVLSPEASLCYQPANGDVMASAKKMFEACGIFSLVPQCLRLAYVQKCLVEEGVLTRDFFGSDGIYGYSDERGKTLPFADPEGEAIGWTPAFDRFDRVGDLWKRPPLTSVDNLAVMLEHFEAGPRNPQRRALSLVRNGAGSPAEVYANLLLCSGNAAGGESWGSPELNRRVPLSAEARALSHMDYCIADALWKENRSILEVLGEAYHADREGYRVASGRTAALECMGYSVAELPYNQMSNLELFDAVLPSLANKLGFSLCNRTVGFLERRNSLHASLFGTTYEQESAGF